jgi:single-stranded-DNA-specific exonuclease
MRHAGAALSVLLEEDPARAAALAKELDDANADRQRASDAMYKEALAQIGDPAGRTLIVAVGNGWSPGLVGLVAGKIVSKFGKPAYVVGVSEEGKRVGSGRSVEGFDVTDCLRSASEHLDKFGGHPQACGFSVAGEERFAKAVAAMTAYADRMLAGRDLAPTVRVDVETDVADITWDLYDELERFAPFGEGNPRPTFASRGVTVSGLSTVGADGKHLRLTVTSPRGKMAKMIGFGFGEWAEQVKIGDRLDVAYEVGVNEWNGNRELQLRIVDLVVPDERSGPVAD